MIHSVHHKEREKNMYLRILKKDLKRKKTMNAILLLFIILAATFIASSVNNMVSVITALDSYFEKAGVPDYWFCVSSQEEMEHFQEFADSNGYDYRCLELITFDPGSIRINGQKFDYINMVAISSLKNSIKVFDNSNHEITAVNDGEIYVAAGLFYAEKYGLREGARIELTINGKTKEFTLKGAVKDAEYGSDSIGMTRMLVSENDFAYFQSEDLTKIYSVNVYTDDADYSEKFLDLCLNTQFSVDKNAVKTMYFMDMLTAAVMLIVSVCLILISMVILRFTINFTMSEEFREIGVMKAIGIANHRIRGLYIVKYSAISAVGAVVGFVLSIPFGRMLLRDTSRNIVMPNTENFILNLVCAVIVAAVVVLFCYRCTRKIKGFSPIDAIRNGENGERYSRKSVISLGRSGMAPVPFMAVNDIFSELKRFITMLLIFVLGLLLIIIPVNTLNTLQSDQLISMFSMAECDHIISREMLFFADRDNKQIMDDDIDEVRTRLAENGIRADVWQEAMFRMTISYNGKKVSSLAFQGRGDIGADMYTYLEGTAPDNENEAAITKIIADKIGADIGDTVEIINGEEKKKYIITALYQSMNNMGEGIRFYQGEELDYSCVMGCFGIQIKYTDSPDKKTLEERKALLKELYPDNKVLDPGEYIGQMIGESVAEQIQSMKRLILLVVLCINVFVTVLMVKSFIAKEKGEIAMLKAIGFGNGSLIGWQTMRIGIVMLISIVTGILLVEPLTKLTVNSVFYMMGAQSIRYEIVPLEVYVIYPLILLAATILVSMLAALQIRKIAASETSNIE